MKTLRISAAITAILGFLTVAALIFLFLALADIAQQTEDLTLEWQVTGCCILVIAAFTVSTFVTLGLLIRSGRLWSTIPAN